jgi:PAS domain S-box-containing protein
VDSETEKGKNRDELLAELEVYQLELEMQNEQLSFSYEMLENERSKFADFFDLAPVGYFVLDPEGKVQEANQTGIELFGTAKNKLLFKDFKFFITDESRDSLYVFMKQMKSSVAKRTCEVKVIHKDNTVLYLRLEGLKVKHKFNESFQYYVTAVDITTSNLAQQRLMDTKQRLELTLRASGTGTWVMELDQRKLTFDDYCLSILELDNLTFDEDIRSFIGTIHPDDQQSMSEALRAATSDFEPLDLEFRIVTKRGIIKYIAVKGHRVVNVSSNYFAGILVDITEKKRQINNDWYYQLHSMRKKKNDLE